MTEPLEQRAENSEVVVKRCRYCEEKLNVPKDIDEKLKEVRVSSTSLIKDSSAHLLNLLKKQYTGFYVSGCGNYYCNNYCFTMFTED